MKKGTKWAIVAVSCCLLASMAKGCATGYENTGAQATNNQAPVSNYVDDYENIRDNVEDLFDTVEDSNILGK